MIDAPGFYEKRYAYTRCRFIFGGRGYVDPVKEAEAANMRMETGLSTMEDECAEQGKDYEEVLDQQQIEARMRADRGLPSLYELSKGRSPTTKAEKPAEQEE